MVFRCSIIVPVCVITAVWPSGRCIWELIGLAEVSKWTKWVIWYVAPESRFHCEWFVKLLRQVEWLKQTVEMDLPVRYEVTELMWWELDWSKPWGVTLRLFWSSCNNCWHWAGVKDKVSDPVVEPGVPFVPVVEPQRENWDETESITLT